jgi:O-antigen/teichoic acid export membrane protein
VSDVEAPAPRRGLLGPGVVVAAGLAVGQVLSYAQAVAGARALGPAGFGELSTLTNLLVIGAVVALAVQTVSARRVAAAEPGSEPGALVRLGLSSGTVVTVVGLALVPLVVVVLRLPWVAALAVALTLLPLTLAGTGLGRAQGDQHFVRLGWLYAVLAATRFGLGITVLVVTRSVTATVVAALVGAVLGWLLVRWRESLPWTSSGRLDLDVRREAWHTTHALLAMFVLTSCDLLLARYVLPADEAGQYAAGSVVLKIAFWLPQVVAVVVFPRLAQGERGTLLRGTVAVVVLGLLVTVGFAVTGPWLLPWLLGPAYASIAAQSWVFGLAGTAEAAAYLLLFSRLAARDRLAAVAVWGAVALLTVLVLTVAHGSPAQIAVAVAAVATALCGVGAWANLRATTTARTPTATT